jgi:hypothetical protein
MNEAPQTLMGQSQTSILKTIGLIYRRQVSNSCEICGLSVNLGGLVVAPFPPTDEFDAAARSNLFATAVVSSVVSHHCFIHKTSIELRLGWQ